VADIIGSGLAFPFRLDRRGAVALVSGEAELEQAIRLILGTAPGERPMRPEFGCGVHDFVFESIDASMLGQMEQAVRIALDRWEPRIRVQRIDFELGEAAEGRLGIVITYLVRATSIERNLVYPFYVIPAEEFE
jgi:phage baseplate assembly protein W